MSILTICVLDKENPKILKQFANCDGVKLIFCNKQEETYEFYQNIIESCDSKYITFWDDTNSYTTESIACLIKSLKDSNSKVLTVGLSDGEGNIFTVKDSATSIRRDSGSSLYFNRFIFARDFIANIDFKDKEKNFYQERVLLEISKHYSHVPILKNVILNADGFLENDVNLYHKQYLKEWYLDYFRDFLIPYVNSHDLCASEKKLIMYYIRLRFYLNLNSREKLVIQNEEVDIFFDYVRQVLMHIDDSYILIQFGAFKLPKTISYLFFKLKYGDKPFINVVKDGNEISHYFNGEYFGKAMVTAAVTVINYAKESLLIDVEIVGDYLIEDFTRDFFVELNGRKINYILNEPYNITKAFGKSVIRFKTIQVKVPTATLKQKNNLKFCLKTYQDVYKLPISFENTFSRLVKYKYSHYFFANKMLHSYDDVIYIEDRKFFKALKYELKMILHTVKMRDSIATGIFTAMFRVLYWLTHFYNKKNIWIFFDKLYKAGDNAEYLFEYCYKNNKDCKPYYIVSKDAIDYPRLKKIYGKNILVFNSFRQKLIVLHARMIFATHASVLGFCGFGKSLQNCYRDLLNADVACIQHGLTIQNIAQYQNRLKDNTRLYFCASKYEIENLERPVYDYTDEVYLTGLPRYDGLVDVSKKQILIAPTWRRNIVITGNKIGTSKQYNPNFKHTEYFRIYNSLINDERLLKSVAEHGYRLVFLIHPTLSSQLEDFDTNDYLDIIPAISDVSYEKMLTESNLMLTDYSGIQFDFAYMKKPIVYYHPSELPPQYDEGIYKYDSMGFGPIIENYDEMINSICDYVADDCKMKDEYKKRVDDFFEYTDHSNCERIVKVVNEKYLKVGNNGK